MKEEGPSSGMMDGMEVIALLTPEFTKILSRKVASLYTAIAYFLYSPPSIWKATATLFQSRDLVCQQKNIGGEGGDCVLPSQIAPVSLKG